MKDAYVQRWFSEEQKLQRELQLFFLHKLFRKDLGLVFKGGTALDLFYGSGRFSEDLDFNCSDSGILVEIDEAIDSIASTDKYAVLNDWPGERELHKKFARYNLRATSRGSKVLTTLLLDCTMDTPLYPPDSFVLAYNDSLTSVKVMKAQEIVAEKVSALLTRERARDLYDLHFLVAVMHIQISLKDIYEKCAKGVSGRPRPYSFKIFSRRVGMIRKRWKELDPLLSDPGDYEFEEVSGKVLELFKGL